MPFFAAARVLAQVPCQVSGARVLLLADGALVGPLPGVREHVLAQVARRRVAVSARRARVRRLVRVYVHVPFQRARLREPLLADGALVRPLAGVHLAVSRQVTVTAELLATQLAAVRQARGRPVRFVPWRNATIPPRRRFSVQYAAVQRMPVSGGRLLASAVLMEVEGSRELSVTPAGRRQWLRPVQALV